MRAASLALASIILLNASCAPAENRAARPTASSSPGRPGANLGQAPLLFIPNQGQMESQVAYYLQGQDTAIYFAADGLTVAITGQANGEVKSGRWVLKLDFVGANPDVFLEARDPAETVVSYFKGAPEQWHTGLPTFRRLVYCDLWPGIDLVFSSAAGWLKYEFVIHPGASPDQIRLAYRGATGLKQTPSGQLEVETPLGSLYDDAPVAYQLTGADQRVIPVTYALAAGRPGESSPEAEPVYTYHFQVADYDPTRPLIIDPIGLVYAGYIGGSNFDISKGIVVDNEGAAYIAGETLSGHERFPVSVGPDLTYNGEYDAFVAKIRPDGSGLVYAGYIGGSAHDYALGIAVDEHGAAYISGRAFSDETSFPVLVGPDLTHNGAADVFVAKVKPDGSGLIYAGYIGGGEGEEGYGIAVDKDGSAYVTGYTDSAETTFPVRGGPDPTYNGLGDAFVARVNPEGSELIYAGYIGGSGTDLGRGLAIDANGAVYVVGRTDSDEATFPVLVGPDLTYNGSYLDAYVAKVRPDGSGLEYCGYIGGSEYDIGIGIAVDGDGAAYIAGYTASDQTTFPVRGGPDLIHDMNEGNPDAFVAKVRPDGDGLVYCGYVGGSGEDVARGMAVDESGAAYIMGYTESDETTFPVLSGPDLTYNGIRDAYAAKVLPDGSKLVYCGYIGGSEADEGFDIAVDRNGAAYVVGKTNSDPSTFPLKIGPGLAHNGGYPDAFVAKIDPVFPTYLPVVINGQ